MTPAGEKIAAEIRNSGPIPFSRFMEIALYDEVCGYYRGARRDPFGKEGDFFTASQLQPVFGRLAAAALRDVKKELAADEEFTVVEWGAGRGEMREALGEFRYCALDVGRGKAPERFTGAVFSNELFDALPVDVAKRMGIEWRALRVDLNGSQFTWRESEPLGEIGFADALEDGAWVELPVRVRDVMRAMSQGLERGVVIAIDYGITERERVRFPQGTLMSYRRHRALDDVLQNPGEQDITSHVPFDLLNVAAHECGLAAEPLLTLSQWILSLDEKVLEGALAAGSEAEATRLRLQFKTLLVGMGETFRVAVWRRP